MYTDLKYKPKGDLVCKFRVEAKDLKKAAEALATESSVGTWTDVKTISKRIQNMGAKAFRIDRKKKQVWVAYPLKLFEPGNLPQLLSSVAGNIFGMKVLRRLRLEDIEFPRKYIQSFKGPRHGIKGVRKLTGVKDRPLVGTIVKPKLGLKTKKHAKVAYQAWKGGCDLVKDDENLSSQGFNPFKKRVRETLKARKKAEKETGEKKVYLPNVTAPHQEMKKRLDYVEKKGGRYVMVDVVTTGFSSLQDMDTDLVIHAHRAMHAAFTRGRQGISMKVLAKLCRLAGVDQLHIGTVFGKMEGGKEEVLGVRDALVEKNGLKPVFPVCSGGLHPGLIPKLIRLLGKDIIIQMGGGIHGHPRGTETGARAARQAVDMEMGNIDEKPDELKEALKEWTQN